MSPLRVLKRLTSTILTTALIMFSCTNGPGPNDLLTKESRNTDTVSGYEILEQSFKHNGIYKNNFIDVSLEVVFTSPGGMEKRVKGFFYSGDLWKIRFRPDEPGHWTYTYLMTSKTGFRQEGKGAFYCRPSNNEGPVRQNPENPFRWVFANDKPYFPVGLQDCPDGTSFSGGIIDGEGREEGGRHVSLEEYFSIYGKAGFNLFRFSQKNCSYKLYDDLDHYREAESLATDKLLSLARKYDFRVMFGFFGFHSQGSESSLPLRVLKRALNKFLKKREDVILARDEQIIAKEKRFIEYAVARWGVYVDFWELLNERKASDEWAALMADYVRSIDPDRKPISTSWEKPYLSAIDINAPHWYESESEFKSDLRVQEQAAQWKKAGKPVIVGEQGNTGMNWDPLSGLRMRIRTWTALFQEISFIFWNTCWSKAGMHHGRYTPGAVANIYLGPEERGYIRVLQDFSSKLDADVRMAPVEVFPAGGIRAYGLLSKTVAAAYLHHFENHNTTLNGVKITLDIPGDSSSQRELYGEWIDPSTGKVLARVHIRAGRQTLDVPSFAVDFAFLITPQE